MGGRTREIVPSEHQLPQLTFDPGELEAVPGQLACSLEPGGCLVVASAQHEDLAECLDEGVLDFPW
ncbi:hypothetical protein FrCorBMG51_22135 [Protofrankia coriariae]|uniref:Uncharacterized protein n=1 Tax=Protofrankia coriariae TaxID=1562887 RepID=A0ABR5EZF7_9ACTN|nr:hypothetical protein FrCorBMG51_22135 [Protofrankia coriariae]